MILFKHAARVAAATLALLAASGARADYVWIEPAGAGVRILAGEIGAPRPLSLYGAKILAASGKPVDAPAQGVRWDLPVVPPGDLRFSARAETSAGTLEFLHARSGRLETRAGSDLELVPTQSGGSTFRLFWKGEAVSASQVRVSTATGWHKTLRPAGDGSVTLDTPIPGLYVLVVSARMDGGAAVVDGKRYNEVRHTATLSFREGE